MKDGILAFWMNDIGVEIAESRIPAVPRSGDFVTKLGDINDDRTWTVECVEWVGNGETKGGSSIGMHVRIHLTREDS